MRNNWQCSRVLTAVINYVVDMFTSTLDKDKGQWGIVWWREGNDGRPWYFGSNSHSGAFGHQGFTGILVAVDSSIN